jgi:hypothetical protein
MRKSRYRPELTRLEDRLPPGDMGLGMLFQPSLVLDPSHSLLAPDNLVSPTVTGISGGAAIPADAGTVAPAAPAPVNGNGAPSRPADSSSAAALPADPLKQDLLTPVMTSLGSSGGSSTRSGRGFDIVTMTIQPDSFVLVGSLATTFGTTATINNVYVGFDYNVYAAQGDIHLPSADATFMGFRVHIDLRAQSDLFGLYFRDVPNYSGFMYIYQMLDVKLTSPDIPGFDNDNCIQPVTTLNMDTLQAIPFSGGDGWTEDSYFNSDAFPHGACGSFFGQDWADAINQAVGLPSSPGNNVIGLHIIMDPALPPP